MTDTERYDLPQDPAPNRDTIQYEDWSRSTPPDCAAHHTYVPVSDDSDHSLWVCPSCGRFSDRVESYTGGYKLTAPAEIDPTQVITIDGRFLLRGENDRFPKDDGIDVALVSTPYEARDDVKSFEGWRRWDPDLRLWRIEYRRLNDFVSEMESAGWIVINVHAYVT